MGDLMTLIVPAGPHFTAHAPSLLPVGSYNHGPWVVTLSWLISYKSNKLRQTDLRFVLLLEFIMRPCMHVYSASLPIAVMICAILVNTHTHTHTHTYSFWLAILLAQPAELKFGKKLFIYLFIHSFIFIY